MNKFVKKFSIHILIVTGILILVSGALYATILYQYYYKAFPIVILFFAAFSFFQYQFCVNKEISKQGTFARNFLITTTIKILVLLFLMLIFIFTNRENAVSFLVSILVLYFIFTIFEIYSLLIFSKNKK